MDVTAEGHSRGRFPRRTEAAALAAAAVVALHVLTDAFVAPEPGVRPADHIVSGVAPLALLVAACGAFWLSRAGLCAVVSLLLGILALEGFALAVADARAVGARGDDWTGFALAPAGLTLVVLGVVLLWRSRKRQGRWLLRRSLIGAAALLGVYWLVIPVGVALLATHRPHEAVETVDVGLPSRPVTLRTADGLDLHGRYVASRNGAAVIVFPGSASRAAQARALVRHGYGVLMLDMRGYANSDGDPNMFGWNGRKDVDAGVAFLTRRADVRDGRIGGLGFSVGGEVMLEAAAGNRALLAVVADGAGERSVRESRLRGRAGLLSLPSYLVQTTAVAVLSGDRPPPSLVDLVPRIAPRSVLLIGTGSDNGGEDLQPHYFAAAKEPKAFWKIPEAGHTGGFVARPREYARRLTAFFDAALLAPPADGSENRISTTPCTVRGYTARCGTLLVPENRARLHGRKIGLRVVVIPSARQPARPDAFTYLAGGPGAAATEMTDSVMSIWSAVNNDRDILLVDQRGTGRSNPLTCRPPDKPISKPGQMRAIVRSCLRSAPGDMRFYGTRAAMDDLEAVRVALGYRQLNVYGTSYGATAAQVYLKRHPDSVRTIVLDGATAIDVPFYGRFAVNAENALAQVANRCAADSACRRAYPNWRGQLSSLIRRWDAHPVQHRKGETINGAGLAGVIQGMLQDAGDAAEIPYVVSRTAAGDYRRLNERISGSDGPILQLMYWSIWCNEPWVGMDENGPWGTDFDSYARISVASHREACSYLPKRAEPASAWASPRSRVPLLALAGGADPQDPISNLPRREQLWPRSRAIVVPHLGHAIGQEGCLGELVTRFVARGSAAELDTRCVDKIKPPMFELP